MTRLTLFILVLLFFSSCERRLNEVTVKGKDIEVKWYQISEITTMHDFIEVKKGSSTIKIMEANSHGFVDIVIIGDVITIQYLPTVIYKLADKVFNYKIKLDTTITLNHWRQKVEEREKLKK